LSGERCNIDAFELYETAKQQHVLEAEMWPSWISEQISRPESFTPRNNVNFPADEQAE